VTSQFPTIFNRNNHIYRAANNRVFTKNEFLELFDVIDKKDSSVDFKSKYLNSLIIETNEEYNQLCDLCQFGNQKWKLIYQASRDGFRAADFHQKCDGIHNTLTLVKTTDSCVFGGFTGAAWSSTGEFEEDECSFLFSLKNKMKQAFLFECTNDKKAIRGDKELGPCFGEEDLLICHASNLNKRSQFSVGKSFGNKDESKNLSSNSNGFQSAEIEVFCKDYPKLSSVIDCSNLY